MVAATPVYDPAHEQSCSGHQPIGLLQCVLPGTTLTVYLAGAKCSCVSNYVCYQKKGE